MAVAVETNVFEVVVLATYPQALLRVGYAL
jgi:hypothetical protein